MQGHEAFMFRHTHRPHVRCGDVKRPHAAQSQVNVHYATNQIGPIVQQARQAPAVVLPVTPPGERTVGHQAGVPAATVSDADHVIYPSASKATGRPRPSLGRSTAAVQLQGQQQGHLFPTKKFRPSRMDFELMYQQLYEWKQQYLSAHVPRYCFDAPELGAWVRKMRKKYKDQQLEQWKIERLNQLSFEWDLTDQDAKWHHLYHQLRRYQLLHGSTDIDISHNQQDGYDWSQVAWWLKKQARLLAKQKLSSHKRDMLAQLGVTLRIPKRIVTRTAQLQALNGPERRKLRKKWKKLDQAAADEVREQHEQLLQQQEEQEQRQQEITNRRLSLLRDAAGTISGDTLSTSTSLREGGSYSSSGIDSAVQQQYYAQVGLLPQQQQDGNAPAKPSVQKNYNNGSKGSAAAHSRSAADRGSRGTSGRPPDTAGLPQAGALLPPPLPQQQQQQQQQQCPDSTLPGTAVGDSQQAVAGDQQRQRQQQQQRMPGLLYQRNRRSKRVSSSTKQERWLSANRRS